MKTQYDTRYQLWWWWYFWRLFFFTCTKYSWNFYLCVVLRDRNRINFISFYFSLVCTDKGVLRGFFFFLFILFSLSLLLPFTMSFVSFGWILMLLRLISACFWLVNWCVILGIHKQVRASSCNSFFCLLLFVYCYYLRLFQLNSVGQRAYFASYALFV